jgi:DNA-binding transcriptional LysR family regulator
LIRTSVTYFYRTLVQTGNGHVAEANWDLYRLFFAVARSGSVNRAAHELGMSQPTLSRRLQELEWHIGAPLFYRASSGVRLTKEGEELQRSAATMMVAFESLQHRLRSQVGQRASVVRISATEGLTKHWLLPRVKRLRELNSRVQLEIVSTVYQQSVATSDLDFVIRMGDPGEDDLVGKKVAIVSIGIFGSVEYLAKRRAPRTLAELKDFDIIGQTAEFPGFKNDGARQMQLFRRIFAASEAKSVIRVSPMMNHFAAAAEGIGLALLVVPFALAEGLVRVLPEESASVNVWLLRRKESDLRKLTREVRRFLENEFSKSKAWLGGQT